MLNLNNEQKAVMGQALNALVTRAGGYIKIEAQEIVLDLKAKGVLMYRFTDDGGVEITIEYPA